jgi:Tfp pilus assembly protein PilV
MNKTASSLILADGNGLQWLDAPPAAAGSESGFSLVEVLLAAGLISFLLVGTAELLIQSIRVQRKSDRALRIAGVMAAEAERVKTLPFDAGELASGNHEIEIALQPGDELVTVAWTVEDEGTSLKKVNFKLSRDGNSVRPLEAVLLISRDLGF